LVEHLRARDLLLVLDNCEHVLDRAAELVETLVQSCPKLTVLATSREALGVAGEVSWRVPSLSVPDPRHSLSLDTLENFEAVRLFVDRARVRVIGFTLDDVDGPAVVQICRRLDGIPLAIELAAARIDTLAAPELAVRLEDRFRLLTGGSRMGVERHQTLRAAVDWSYDALSAPERGLLERMSVFAGGCTLEAAEVVCTGGGLERDAVVDVMSQLVAKSLVVVDRQPRTARYRLFEIIRQYAREKLIASGEHERVRGRHSDWSAALLAQVERGVWGRDQATWLSVVDAELDNLRQALDYAVGEGNVEVALGMAGALGRFWMIRYSWEEGLRWLLDTLALEGAERFPFLRAQALNTAALLEVSYAGDIEAGRTLATQALDGFRELGTRRGIFWALHTLSTAAGWTGDHEAAAAYADEGLAVARASGHQPTIAYALHQRAVVAYHTGDYTAADAILAEATPVMRNAADLSGLARVLVTRGWALLASRQFASAEPILQEALIFYRQLGDQAGICLTLISLGGAALLAGDVDQAASCFEAAHPISTDNPAFDVLAALARGCLALDQGDLSQTETELTRSAQGLVAMRRSAPQWGSAPTLLAAFAKLSAGKGFFEKAARLFGAATEIHETDPLRHVPMRWIFYEHLHAKYLQLTMAALDDDAFNWAFEHGRAMSTEHALTYALKASQT
jgi:non-specific serine/threonine protein kinase